MASTSRSLLRMTYSAPMHTPVAGPSTYTQVRHKGRASYIAVYLERKRIRAERDALGLPRIPFDSPPPDSSDTPEPHPSYTARPSSTSQPIPTFPPKPKTPDQLALLAHQKATQPVWRDDLLTLPASSINAWKRDARIVRHAQTLSSQEEKERYLAGVDRSRWLNGLSPTVRERVLLREKLMQCEGGDKERAEMWTRVHEKKARENAGLRVLLGLDQSEKERKSDLERRKKEFFRGKMEAREASQTSEDKGEREVGEEERIKRKEEIKAERAKERKEWKEVERREEKVAEEGVFRKLGIKRVEEEEVGALMKALEEAIPVGQRQQPEVWKGAKL